MPDKPKLICTKEMASLSGMSVSNLVRLRNYRPGDSPPFIQLGRQILYSVDAFDEWVRQRVNATARVSQ